jgi:fluoride exporter
MVMGQQLSWPRRLLAVAGGGFLGTLARYGLSLVIQSYLGKGWPYDIFLINITGACMLALFTTCADAAFLIGPTRRLFINVGFVGAYTTFSTFALGDILLMQQDHWLLAFLYLGASIVSGLLAILLGQRIGLGLVERRYRFRVYRAGQAGEFEAGRSLLDRESAERSLLEEEREF